MKTVKMKMKPANDTLVHAYHPLDSPGNVMDDFLYIEKYVRRE